MYTIPGPYISSAEQIDYQIQEKYAKNPRTIEQRQPDMCIEYIVTAGS